MNAPARPLATKSRSHPLATELSQRASALGDALSPIEQSCLDVGMRLTEALPGLGDLKTQFETLAQSLDSDGIDAAIDDLNRIANELVRAADEISEESEALIELVGLNRTIGEQVSTLLTCMRTISSLVFSMKIEAAPLDCGGEDLTAFAEGVQRLSERGRRSLYEYQATCSKLDALLSSSCAAQTQFQRSHQAGLRAIAVEILESLGAVADLRRRTLVALRDIGMLSREIGDRIGQCLTALQVGDSARQRVEHVQAALDISANRLDDVSPLRLVGAPDAESATDELVVARLCRLQAQQIDDTQDEYAREIATVSALIEELVGENNALARRGQEVFGTNSLDNRSFLEMVERKLAAARLIVAECRSARAVVDQATGAVAATMTDLQERTHGLSEIVGDVTIIGTNALLKSTRLGDRGRGFSVIAQELRGYAGLIVNGINELPPKLDEVAVSAERVGEVGRNLDAGRLGALDVRMGAAIQAFDTNAQQMTEALARLGREAEKVRGALAHATATLAAQTDVATILHEAAAALDDIATRLGDPGGHSPHADRLLDELLRPLYSMASERRVHDVYTGCSDEAEAATTDDDLEAVLF